MAKKKTSKNVESPAKSKQSPRKKAKGMILKMLAKLKKNQVSPMPHNNENYENDTLSLYQLFRTSFTLPHQTPATVATYNITIIQYGL